MRMLSSLRKRSHSAAAERRRHLHGAARDRRARRPSRRRSPRRLSKRGLAAVQASRRERRCASAASRACGPAWPRAPRSSRATRQPRGDSRRSFATGFVTINDIIVPTADPRLPFGGVRGSGFGTTRGAEGLLEMTYPHADRGSPRALSAAPWSRRKLATHRFFTRFHRRFAHGRGFRTSRRRHCATWSTPVERANETTEESNMKRIAVIGGGLGGLASACTLAARGHSVVLFEKNEWLGGKAAVLEQDGFRFDMGPTILTLPSVLKRIFAEAGRDVERRARSGSARSAVALVLRRRHHARSRRRCRSHAPDARRVRRYAKTADGYARFIDYSRRLHRISDQWFFWRSVGGMRDMFDARNMTQRGTLSDVFAMRMGRSVGEHRALVCSGCARGADGRSLHAICRLRARHVAGGALRHRAHADAGRHLVSARRDGGDSGCAREACRRSSAWRFASARM